MKNWARFTFGKTYDSKEKKIKEELLLYDSKDLTTHAACVGMTGSGKTGLCLSLLEEASIDGIPTIIIDPKGDMTNLLLSFPDLAPENFVPWVNKSDAQKKGVSVEDYAAKQAEMWKSGLSSWDQDGERIRRWKSGSDFAIYTPGSSAGIPVSILNSFSAPSKELLEDTDLFSDRIDATVTSILGLLGIEADPLRSKEHILLSTIIKHYWLKGENLDLTILIQAVQSPPIEKIGAFDLESFYPSKERFELAIMINNLLSAPGFQSWFEGEPLEINNLLHTGKGTPRVSIFYIAHLSDAERMFFVSLLLNQMIAWMRSQSGTTSLRAILYFDEIFGYLPPVANPPSKKPLMTLLKQARAFGLGLVVATQNPVDLDYKALSNTGTWFIGRLQTERDREKVLDALEGATSQSGAVFDRKTIDGLLSNLDKRVFLLHNVNEDNPELFYTRWAMSYLAGPLSRDQVKILMSDYKPELTIAAKPKITVKVSGSQSEFKKPSVSPNIKQYFIPVRTSCSADSKLIYKPYLFSSAEVNFISSKFNVDLAQSVTLLSPITDAAVPIDLDESFSLEMDNSELEKQEEENSLFDPLPSAANNSKNYSKWERMFKDHLYRNHKLNLFKSDLLKVVSKPNEDERDFRIRLTETAHEQRDLWTQKLRDKYSRKIQSLQNKIRTAEERIEREQSQAKQQKLQTVISVGATILGAFLGRKAVSSSTVSKAGTSIRSAGRVMKEAGDVNRAKENLVILNQQLADIDAKFQEEVSLYSEKYDLLNEEFKTINVRPKKTNISVSMVNLVWAP